MYIILNISDIIKTAFPAISKFDTQKLMCLQSVVHNKGDCHTRWSLEVLWQIFQSHKQEGAGSP